MDVHRTVWSLCEVPPPAKHDLPPSAAARNPSFRVTSSPPPPPPPQAGNKTSCRHGYEPQPVSGHAGRRRGGGGQGSQSQGRLNHIQHQLGCTQAISFSVQHFCNTRFNHLAAILLNAVYQGKERERERDA